MPTNRSIVFSRAHCKTLLLAVLLLALVSAGYTQPYRYSVVHAATQKSSVQLPANYAQLVAQAAPGTTINIIVGLNTSFSPEGALRTPQAVQSQRAGIAQAQADLQQRLSTYRYSVTRQFTYIPYIALSVDSAALQALAKDPGVSSIQEDRNAFLRSSASSIPAVESNLRVVGADIAWATGSSGQGWTVAVLDTGADRNHPYFDGKVVAEACYSTNGATGSGITSLCPGEQNSVVGVGASGGCPSTIDGCDHGAHVAGIAVGKAIITTTPTSGTPVTLAGVAKDATLISVQVFRRATNCGSSPSPCVTYLDSDVIAGMEYVYSLRNTHSIAAVNMSLGSSGKYTDTAACDADHAAQKAAIDNLRSAGIASLIASGNSGFSDGIEPFACISTAVSVGSTNIDDTISPFTSNHQILGLLAPGANIYSATFNNNFKAESGTSQATPHVAGAWAVLKSKMPTATVDDILTLLKSSGKPITDPRNNVTKPRLQIGHRIAAPAVLQANSGGW